MAFRHPCSAERCAQENAKDGESHGPEVCVREEELPFDAVDFVVFKEFRHLASGFRRPPRIGSRGHGKDFRRGGQRHFTGFDHSGWQLLLDQMREDQRGVARRMAGQEDEERFFREHAPAQVQDFQHVVVNLEKLLMGFGILVD